MGQVKILEVLLVVAAVDSSSSSRRGLGSYSSLVVCRRRRF